jgi:SMI1-KNR4 cell-wall
MADDLTFENVGQQLTEEDLITVERAVGPFPEDLRNHYLRFNGGQPTSPYLEDDSGAEGDIEAFLTVLFPILPGDLTLETYYRLIVLERKEFPSTHLPFARNGGDDLYVMERDTGRIYFWAHDVPAESLKPVARSLSDLFAKLQTEEEFYA